MTLRDLFTRAVRSPHAPPQASYPPAVQRALFWYDRLTDWQRIQYAGIASLFLLACGGYLLGLGSTILLQRVEAEEAALAAAPLPTLEPTAVVLADTPTAVATNTRVPSPTAFPPTAAPSVTPFSAPVIAEPPAVPRQLPAAPVVVAPVAPRATATPDKPRNLETSKPEPPAASISTSTPGLARTVRPVVPTAVRQATPTATTSSRAAGTSTALPTLAMPATTAPTSRVPAQTPKPTVAPTPAKTAAPH